MQKKLVPSVINVKSLSDALQQMPAMQTKLFEIPLLDVAGLTSADADVKTEQDSPAPVFHQRSAVSELWSAIDDLPAEKGEQLLFVKGQPGTGKSTAIGRKVLSRAADGSRISL